MNLPTDPPSPTERLFIALAPAESLRETLCAIRDRLHNQAGGRAMPAGNLHLTLAFLGDTPTARIPELLQLLAALPRREFVWRIERAGSFKAGSPKGCIVWAGGETPAPLAALVEDVWATLRANRFPFDSKQFRPHVTLLRDARPVDETLPPLDWQAGPPLLYRSVATPRGPRYEVITR
ncbi:RNA 2',3'-cyclic phosphodiesterase [Chitiniphilus eburneus]|uniref:RNA 2',3'-cyclic phosphodiesterase n=1 Tax=Chitiniphilus eburneus TaxID=2571148 RepID=A0A4U0Q5C0_9NEIS|nr:RNA 2',3'-cyclic phosphodiesterase [Chitiniphilus eburneus]TJZ76279.1 RNA 2',3'-cyclic phosphodiesterase [Chitiniphilus eburneus]